MVGAAWRRLVNWPGSCEAIVLLRYIFVYAPPLRDFKILISKLCNQGPYSKEFIDLLKNRIFRCLPLYFVTGKPSLRRTALLLVLLQIMFWFKPFVVC